MSEPIRDRYESYFAEKIWEWIPPVYRHEDGIAERPGQLRALVEILAEQAAELKRSQDRLWEDQSIESCDEWTVPYLADLLATRLVSALDARARRADVANTIHYRRRKGTPPLLERLAGDLAGWESVAVEGMTRLARAWHRLDPSPPRLGRVTGTPRGGFADLRSVRASMLADGPFDELFRTPDPRAPRDGRVAHNIPTLSFYTYRLQVQPVLHAQPRPRSGSGGAAFTFDPSGRDIELFARRARDPAAAYYSAREWEVPAPIACRLLSDARYRLTEAVVRTLVDVHGLPSAAAAELRPLREVLFRDEAALRRRLTDLPSAAVLTAPAMFAAVMGEALVPECGKAALVPRDLPGDGSVSVEETPGTLVPREMLGAGRLDGWTSAATDRRVVVHPELGRLLFVGPAPDPSLVRVSYATALAGAIGAGTYDRARSVVDAALSDRHTGGGPLGAAELPEDRPSQIGDSLTYGPVVDRLDVTRMTVSAADGERPYVRLASDWTLGTTAGADAELVLDGLWIGADAPASLVLDGDWERVVLRHMTLDPGGVDADGAPIAAVALRVAGHVEELRIERCILGPIGTASSGAIEAISIADSVVQSIDGSVPAIDLERGDVSLDAVTILGGARVHRLSATETIATGAVEVIDVQRGCFRFSAAPSASRLPRPYAAHLFGDDPSAWFGSQRFGSARYGQLTSRAPLEVRRGASNGSEMGAFSRELAPIVEDGLRTKIDEYMPFGLVAVLKNQT